MDEIIAKTYTMDELLSKNNKKSRIVKVKKISLAYALIALLFINLLLYESLSGHKTAITVTAYAAENEIELSKDFVNFELSAMPVDGGSDTSYSYVNYNINFRCEGQDIRSITYTCSDQEVTRSNRESTSAYYVENMIVPIDQYSDIIQENNFLYGYYVPGENTANIRRLIGNSYRVNYGDQNSIQYGLIIAAKDEDTYRCSIEETVIKLDIYFNDGSVQHRKIIIKASQDAFSDIQIRLQ
jgi:hypothetical protein